MNFVFPMGNFKTVSKFFDFYIFMDFKFEFIPYFGIKPKTEAMLKNILLILSLILFSLVSSNSQNPDPARQWFMYRGNYASGALDKANLPKTWDAETDENIAWKIEIPGLVIHVRLFGETKFLLQVR